MSLAPFEEIEHTADWALIVRGSTLNALFENAAKGMFSLLDAKYAETKQDHRKLELSELDRETLLVSWLEELLFLLESEQLASSGFRIDIEDSSLVAEFDLHPVNSIKKDIKAVTYNELEIIHDENEYRTTVVFDV